MGNVPQRNDDLAEQLHSAAEIAARLDRLEVLTWAMLDEQISEQEMVELESLLTSAAARDQYVRCVQLHTDLAQHFAPAKDPSQEPTQVLGFLGDAMPKCSPSKTRGLT